MKIKKVLIVGVSCVDTSTVSNIINTVLNTKDGRTFFTCVGYSEKDYKVRIDDCIECIGVKDPFLQMKYRLLRRVFLLVNRDNYNLTHYYILTRLKRFCKNTKYDCVVSCSGRFCYTSAAYEYAKKNRIPFRVVFFDSFVYNPYTRNQKLREKVEDKWFSYADKVFVNIEAQNQKREGQYKIEFFKIPIREQYINCEVGCNFVYGGLFYRGIRDPSSIIQFADMLDNSMDKIICFSNYKMQIQHKNIMSYDLISHNDFINECKKAKALIYIGNLGTNAKSSKFLEYISLHKPIIGINVSDDDEVRQYPFYYDSTMNDLLYRINSIDVSKLNSYCPIKDFPDRNPVYLYKAFFM